MKKIILLVSCIALSNTGFGETLLQLNCQVFERHHLPEELVRLHIAVTSHSQSKATNPVVISTDLVFRNGRTIQGYSFWDSWEEDGSSATYSGTFLGGSKCDTDYPRTCYGSLSVKQNQYGLWQGFYSDSYNGGADITLQCSRTKPLG